MAIALALTALWNRILPAASSNEGVRVRWWHLAAGLAAAVLVTVVLLSSFFTNPRGPVDGVLTYLPWISRAGGESPHVHPWYFYLRMLVYWRFGDGLWWSEGLIVALAGAGFVVSLLPARYNLLPGASVPFARWAGFYALMLTAVYSAIPYKTPWCLLGFLHAMIIVAGVGAVALVRVVPTVFLKALMILILLAATGHLAWQSHSAVYNLATDPRCPEAHHHPYVYAHTLPDAKRLHQDVEQLALAAPEGHRMPIAVVWQDAYYWPLPWYLRRFDHVGYWTDIPDAPMAPVVLSSPEFDAALTEKLADAYLMTGYYGLRPNVLAQLWVREDVWEAHLRRLGRL
jgi:predicted membrane-bound mannosyltransferase